MTQYCRGESQLVEITIWIVISSMNCDINHLRSTEFQLKVNSFSSPEEVFRVTSQVVIPWRSQRHPLNFVSKQKPVENNVLGAGYVLD